MVGSSKILTVSYGTFSCTLEGFDQPFETMKSIAEYFRDLAADDRYFGAEPPQPDMQMLHQIAQREVKRRVETTVQKNGVVLRQTADALTGDALPPVAPERPRARSDDDRRPSGPRSDPGDNTPFEVDIDGDSVAAKLSRIRAVVARARANRTADTAFVEDEPVEAYLDTTPATPDEDGAALSDDEDDFADEAATGDDSEPPTSLAALMAEAETALDDAEDEAAEWARIASEADEATAEEARIAREADEAAAEEARIAREADEAAAKAAAIAAAAVMISQAPIARVIKLKRTEFEAALAAGEIEEVQDDDDQGDDQDMVAEIEVDSEDDAIANWMSDDDIADELEIEDDLEADEEDEDQDLAETIAAALNDDPGQDETDEEPENVFAAAGVDSPDSAEDGAEADDTLTEGIRDLIGQTSLESEDEADLAAELAAVEREAAAAAVSAETEMARAKARFSDRMDDADQDDNTDEEAPVAENDEQALNRLLDETNAKLSDSEGSRRRSAIAHLKAAVASTKADRLLKGNRAEKVEDESLNRYRDDLAQVVRPRRTVAGAPKPGEPAPRERPADLAARPAPLMLVSEQRIDKPTPAAGGQPMAVRPRRVSASPPAPEAEPQAVAEKTTISFLEYAEARGATDLPDVLEAAVAYAAEVEGRSELSRPQILRKAASLHPDLATSREKGLQSFGQLLRSGRIRKVGLGQFALPETPGPRQNRASGQ